MGNRLSATGSCPKPHWGPRSLDLVCRSVCFVSQMRSLMNISPLPHGASQQSQHLCPSTASLSSTKKPLLPAARISSHPRWPLSPFLSREPGRAGALMALWGWWGWPHRACLSELRMLILVRQPEDISSKGRAWEWVSVACNGLLLLPFRPVSNLYLFSLQTTSLLN